MYDHTTNAGNRGDYWKHKVLRILISILQPKMYLDTHCGAMTYSLPGNKKWISSWAKVYLETVNNTLIISDSNSAIITEIAKHNLKDVHAFCMDGWSWFGGATLDNFDLIFIDPPYVDPLDHMLAVQAMLKVTAPIMVWFPVFNIENSHHFPKDIKHITIKFAKPDGKLKGCILAFNNMPAGTYQKLQKKLEK